MRLFRIVITLIVCIAAITHTAVILASSSSMTDSLQALFRPGLPAAICGTLLVLTTTKADTRSQRAM